MKKIDFDAKLLGLVSKCEDEIVKLLKKSGHTDSEGIALVQDGGCRPVKFYTDDDGEIKYRSVMRLRINPDDSNRFEYALDGEDVWFYETYEEYITDIFSMYDCLVETLEEEESLNEIKRKVMKLLPNHAEVEFPNHGNIEIGGVTYVLWSIHRDGKTVWVDIEDDTPFGKSMEGRYCINYNDLKPCLCTHILETLLSKNKKD